MKHPPSSPPSVPLDWEQEMARLVGFQQESTSNGKQADYQPENSEPSVAEALEPDNQVRTEQPMWSNPFAKAGVVGTATLVGVVGAGLFLSTIMSVQNKAPTNTKNVVSSQLLRSQATREPSEQPLEKDIEDLKTKLALSRQEEAVIQAQQKLKNPAPTPPRVVQPTTITPQPQPRAEITRTPEVKNPSPVPIKIVQVVEPTSTPQFQPQRRILRPAIPSRPYNVSLNSEIVEPRSREPQVPIYLPPPRTRSSSTFRPSIPTTIPILPPPPPVSTATTPQPPQPNAAEQWATLAKLGSYGQVTATATQPRTPPSTTASRQSPPSSTTDRGSTQASAPASNVQEFSARPNPQVSTTPRPNPQVSTTPRPNPQVSTTTGSNPQVSTTAGSNPQVSTTPRQNPQASTTAGSNPQASTTPRPNPQASTTAGSNPNVNNSNSTNNRSVNPANPVVSQASQSINKTLVLGSRARGTLATAIYGEQNTSSTNNKSISVVRLTQPLKALDNAIALPVGTEIVSQINSISSSGLVQMTVIKIVLNKNGKLTEVNVPSGAITILGNGGKPLIASRLKDNVVSTNSRSFLVGGIRGISKVVGQLNTNIKRPRTERINGINQTVPADPNVFTEVLEGGTTELVSKLTSSQAGRTTTPTNIWVLQSGTKVEIFVNQSIQL